MLVVVALLGANRKLTIPDYSRNQNESFNAIVWSKAPKHKYKGPKALELAGISAVHLFDRASKARGDVGKYKVHPRSRIQSKDKKRINCAKKKTRLLENKKRISRRQAKRVREMEAREKEGVSSYTSGAFSEEDLRGPAKGRKIKREEIEKWAITAVRMDV